MTVLVTGSTGMLGQKIMLEASKREVSTIGVARNGADNNVDLTDDKMVADLFEKFQPRVVINCAAMADIELCEKDPLAAWQINARSVSVIADLCRRHKARLVQISTDHYFTGDQNACHDEQHAVTFLHEYSRTKYAAEAFALCNTQSLVVRTNIVGARGWKRRTFVEWAIDIIENDAEVTLFEDAYVSCIDTRAMARVLFDLVDAQARGVFNVASREVFSKKAFIEALAKAMGKRLSNAITGSVRDLNVKRGESLGLDVEKIEHLLGYNMPTLEQVATALVTEHMSSS